MKKQISIILFIVLCFILTSCGQEEMLIKTSTSPDGAYTVKAYLLEGNATVDFSVKAYSEDKLIYNEYHQDKAEIIWVDNSTVSINGKKLNLSKGETFDWRN